MYCVIHSATDSTIVPEGKHSMGVFVQYAPYHLRDTDWETERDIFGKRCIDTLAQYAPNIPDAIIDYQFLSPKDLEEKLYLTHGHMFHTENALAQLFNARPIRGMSDYRTPGLRLLPLRGRHASGRHSPRRPRPQRRPRGNKRPPRRCGGVGRIPIRALGIVLADGGSIGLYRGHATGQ